jgi:hypothetical protein
MFVELPLLLVLVRLLELLLLVRPVRLLGISFDLPLLRSLELPLLLVMFLEVLLLLVTFLELLAGLMPLLVSPPQPKRSRISSVNVGML